jgi:hypothetical protein
MPVPRMGWRGFVVWMSSDMVRITLIVARSMADAVNGAGRGPAVRQDITRDDTGIQRSSDRFFPPFLAAHIDDRLRGCH